MTLCLVISDKEMFFMFSLYKPIKKRDPRGSHFWPEGHNLNKLGRGLLGLHTNIKALCLVVSDKKIIFSSFPYEYRYLLEAGHFTGDTCSRHLWPQGHHFNNFGRRPVDDATYQISMLYRQEDFSCFPY